MEAPGQKCLFGVFKRGKDEIVDSSCVMKKILRDERNIKDQVCYKRFNKYEEEKFDEKLEYDDIEAGMEIMLWWPYKENDKQPDEGRFRKVHVIETQAQRDDRDDPVETLQKTFIDAGVIDGHFQDATDEDLEGYLLEFLEGYDEANEYKAQKHRKRELKEDLERIESEKSEQRARLKKKRLRVSKSIAVMIEMEKLESKNAKMDELKKSEPVLQPEAVQNMEA